MTVNDAASVLTLVKLILTNCDTTLVTLDEFDYSLREERRFLSDNLRNPALALGAWAEGVLVGVCFVSPKKLRRQAHVGEIHYSVHPQHRRLGIGTRLVMKAVSAVRSERILRRLEAYALSNNEDSIKILLKAGFHLEGTLRGSVAVGGKWIDQFIFAKRL